MKLPPIPIILVGALCVNLGACAGTRPAAPSFSVLPAKGKSFASFQRENEYCQATAQTSIGNESPGEAAHQAAVGSAAVGTALGALAGAAIGSASGHVGAGAAIGAGTGLVAGSVVGRQNARVAGGSVQARYDTVYAQCMTSKGNEIVESMPAPDVVYVYPRPYYWHGGYYRY
jgi:outer membrane lipoprotein SlyB